MSIITLNFGQCGTQLSQELFTNITEDLNYLNIKKDSYYNQCVNKWFYLNRNNKLEARSISICSSNGQTTRFYNKTLPYKFRSITIESGSANNWALGYMEHSRGVVKDLMNYIRHEAERCDNLVSFLAIFSSAGGTGSGIATYVLEKLQDEYTNKILTPVIILPYLDGEIATQSYNSLLMLSRIYPIVDSILLFENQRYHSICNNYLGNKSVKFQDINKLISQQLLSIYQPLNDLNSIDLLVNTCPNSLFKLLQIKHAPLQIENTNNWKYLCGTIQRQSRYDYRYQNLLKSKYITTTIITRGVTKPNHIDFQQFIERNLFVSWLPENECIQIHHQPKKLCNYDNFLSIISNSNSCYAPLNTLLNDATNLFNSKTYLHHYNNFGVDQDYFMSCFEQIHEILDNYKNL